jgi:hypothetical protein
VNTYHLLFLDGDNAVCLAQGLQFDDDVEAIAVASAMVAGRSAELWEGRRLVRNFEAPKF